MERKIPYLLYVLSVAAAIASPSAYARSEEEMKQLERQRIEQALENLDSSKYELQENSFFMFERMGEEIIPELVKVLRDDRSSKRKIINTVYALGRMGKDARQAVTVIMPYLKEEDKDVKVVTIIALGKIGKDAKDAVPYLAKLLYEPDEWIQENTIKALLNIGTDKANDAVREFREYQAAQQKNNPS